MSAGRVGPKRNLTAPAQAITAPVVLASADLDLP